DVRRGLAACNHHSFLHARDVAVIFASDRPNVCQGGSDSAVSDCAARVRNSPYGPAPTPRSSNPTAESDACRFSLFDRRGKIRAVFYPAFRTITNKGTNHDEPH